MEATELLLKREETPGVESVRFSYSRPEQRWIDRNTIRLIERVSGQRRLESLYRAWSRNPPAGENLFSAGVRLMDLAIDTDNAAWKSVPVQGPVLFIANHPFGVVDGLVIGHLATRARPDTKIMTHSLLCQPPEARDYVLPVDFGGTPEAQQTSLLTRRRALDWLTAGHALVVFPAGSVSTSQSPFRGPALEPAWHPFVGKLARLPGLTIIPICFHGQNSRIFQLMSHVHYALRIALLFRETARRIGSTVKVSVGEPVSSAELARFGARDAVLTELRRRTLTLMGKDGPDPLTEFRWPAHISFD